MAELTTAGLCTKRPFPNLSACVRPMDHDGKCVFARHVRGGDGPRVVLYEQGRGQNFYYFGEAVLKEGARLNRVEANAVLWIIENADKGK